MQKQLELWPDQEEQKTQEIWNSLNLQQKKRIITALSRLVGKCVYLKKNNQTREADHEG